MELMTNKPRTKGNELLQLSQQIAHFDESLINYYQNAKFDRKNLSAILQTDEDNFTVIEELDLLTVDITGYASQIIHHGGLKNYTDTQDKLGKIGPFKVHSIVEWYLKYSQAYPQLKLYVEMLDYLRLLLLEYCDIASLNY